MRLGIESAAIFVCVIAFGTSSAWAVIDYTFQDINHPLATLAEGSGTRAFGISGSTIVGDYRGSGIWHGFTYDGSTYTTLDHPLAVSETTAYGISGSNIVGAYKDAANKYHGFLYNGSTYQSLDHPLGVFGTVAHGVSGSTVVGSYEDSAHKHHGFIFDGSSYTTLDDPFGPETWAAGVTSSAVVGYYSDSGFSTIKTHGFLYNGATFTTFDDIPSAQDIFPNTIVGTSLFGHFALPSGLQRGFKYTGGGTTVVQHPQGPDFTVVTGAAADSLLGMVGYYGDDVTGVYRSFITVPEPSCLALLALSLHFTIRTRTRRPFQTDTRARRRSAHARTAVCWRMSQN